MSTAKEEDKDVKNEQTTIKRPPRTTLEGMIWNGMYKAFCTITVTVMCNIAI